MKLSTGGHSGLWAKDGPSAFKQPASMIIVRNRHRVLGLSTVSHATPTVPSALLVSKRYAASGVTTTSLNARHRFIARSSARVTPDMPHSATIARLVAVAAHRVTARATASLDRPCWKSCRTLICASSRTRHALCACSEVRRPMRERTSIAVVATRCGVQRIISREPRNDRSSICHGSLYQPLVSASGTTTM